MEGSTSRVTSSRSSATLSVGGPKRTPPAARPAASASQSIATRCSRGPRSDSDGVVIPWQLMTLLSHDNDDHDPTAYQ